ncbi:hypothetical protein AAFF_G00119560 [Aldrovandia affinis]|uniref:PA14 domain-containing protein n=1 Tax=Aldrovandia affinis TaxID=143900 RepID=A0AAD7RSN4_9TELE|nr:hypothetical protein AAFF_G00119560 [Aldrovandia affinis]
MGWLRKAEYLSLAFLFLWNHIDAQRVIRLTPKTGSLNGATRLTIEGEGFAQANQFSLNSNSEDFGNRVHLVSDTRSIPCDVERDSTHGNQITCYTRPMPYGSYEVRVTVDGVPIPKSRICNGGYLSYWCSYYPRNYRTPTITSISPHSGLPGTLVTVRGRIFTDVYGSNTDRSSNGLNVRVLRTYMGGMPCELLRPNSDDLYSLMLDSENSQWGTMTCRMTGTYIGHHNLSYILDSQYGRSLTEKSVFTVSSLNKLAMFQTYAVVNRVFPSAGSLQGGTILTIEGRFFDETDRPAAVVVGGQDCEILSLSDERITCLTPEHQISNMTVFPGGRGLKMEIWNDSRPNNLEEVLDYDENKLGYSVHWVDSLSYTWPVELEYFVARLSGFIVPTETDNYTFYIRGDDRYALYFSHTGLPQDKVKIAYRNYVYYIEVLVQDYAIVAFVDIGLFKEKSPFTEQQSGESLSEFQTIRANYDIFAERQVVSFENWTASEPVSEVQMVTVNSSCFDLDSCDYTFYSLTCNSHRTGPIPVSASAVDVQNALNSLWSIKPDTVQVTKVDFDTGSEYTVVFNSRRGDYQSLHYESMGADVNITVTELTKGKPSLETFTLELGGISSRPIDFNASESEVQSALQVMVSSECPSEIQPMEDNDVKYFRDYEDDHLFDSEQNRGIRVADTDAFCGQWSLMNPEVLFLHTDMRDSENAYKSVPLQLYSKLCFAYKGYLRNEIGVEFTYQETIHGRRTGKYQIQVIFNKGYDWSYVCVDLLTPLQTEYPGSDYRLLGLNLYRETSNQSFYVDSVYLGKRATTFNGNAVVQTRRPPALGHLGLFVEQISVQKILETKASRVSYDVSVTPYNCGHGFPLLAVRFLQVSNSSEDTVAFSEGWVGVTVTRVQRASPPLTGTFDIEIYGKRIEGVPVNITAEDLQYTLQGVPEMGQLKVLSWGNCKTRDWRVQWLANPGAQPLMQASLQHFL